jgi:hypothetical protein
MHTISRMAALFLLGVIFVPMINAARMADWNESISTLSFSTVAVERTALSAAVIID